MSVVPETSVLDKITLSIMNNSTTLHTITDIWNQCNNWTIEIDQNMLTSQFSNRELTALLLHEIGHVMASNAIPMRIKNVMQFAITTAYSHLNPILNDKLFNKVLKFPILNACTFYNNRKDLKEEIKADKYSAKNGYVNDLLSVITKIESLQKTNPYIDKDNDMMKATVYSLKIAQDLNKRKISLVKHNLRELKTRLPESRMRNELTDFENSLFSEQGSVWDNRKEEFINNRITQDYEKYYTESIGLFKKKLKPILVNELDYIDLKITDIRSVNDQMMLMSYANSKLDLINWYISLLNNPVEKNKYIIPHDMMTLLRYRSRLENSKTMIMRAKIPDLSKEKLVVFYPPGYEG